jgi:hydroxymethylpyrimidine pyrophosphatase-like HAD family hydrolase
MERELKIINKLKEDGWRVEKVNFSGRNTIEASKRFAKISITTEMCSCHGGRMWINEEHTNQHYEISHGEYNEELGYNTPETELDFIIENEMMEYVNKFSTLIYKLVEINKYGSSSGVEKQDCNYFATMEHVTKRILDGKSDIKDYNLIEEEKVQFPNKNMHLIVKRIKNPSEYSWEQNRVWFEASHYQRKNERSEFKNDRTYQMYVEVFNKR